MKGAIERAGVVDALAVVGFVFALATIGAWLAGCGHEAQSAANALTAAQYTAEQDACVERATSHEEADRCRCEVKARYGNPCVGGRP